MKPSSKLQDNELGILQLSFARRGDLIIRFSPELAWHGNERDGKRGRPTRYRDNSIRTILTLKNAVCESTMSSTWISREFSVVNSIELDSTVLQAQSVEANKLG